MYILCLMKKSALELFILSNRVNLCGEKFFISIFVTL